MNCNPGACEERRETAPDNVPYRASVGRSVFPFKNRLEIVGSRGEWWVVHWDSECFCPRTDAEVE